MTAVAVHDLAPAAVTLRDVEATPLDESLRRLERLLSPYTGVIRVAEAALASTEDAPFVAVSCALADTRGPIGVELDVNAVGWSGIAGRARAAALGEAAERYSAGFAPETSLVLASASELGQEAVDPSRFALFHERQYEEPGFPARPFTRRTRVQWVRGFEIGTGAPAWLPAQLVFLAGGRVAGDELIAYSTSNGLACRPTLEEAILSALLEVLERDAFAITWYGRLQLPRLDIEGDEALEAFRERYLAPTGLRCSAVDLSAFNDLPTVLALAHGSRGDAVSLTVGAASAATASEAWRRAVAEAFGSRAWARELRLADPDRRFDASFDDVADFDDHVHLYALRRYAGRASFLCASPQCRAIGEVPPLEGASVVGRIAAILRRLADAGAGAYAVDVTAPDVRAAGLVVVKVLVPELCQLDAIHRARYLGGARLYTAAWKRGLRAGPLSFDELNPDPHPFP